LVVDRVAAHAIAEARRIFVLQRQARWKVARSTGAERQQKLRALGEAIARRRGEIAEAIREDFGKHPTENRNTEIQLTLTELKDAAANVRRWMKGRRVGTPMHLFGTSSEIRYEAKGVVLIMAAWNFPFALIVAPLIAAIAAGTAASATIGESAGEQPRAPPHHRRGVQRERGRNRGGLRRCGGLATVAAVRSHLLHR
jgi:aldehyde dehydrogenase (NAD+)